MKYVVTDADGLYMAESLKVSKRVSYEFVREEEARHFVFASRSAAEKYVGLAKGEGNGTAKVSPFPG